MTPLLARCRTATGRNGNAAALLYRISYWMPKAKIVRGGRKWIANTAAQWCAQTGLSPDQYRRAISLLRKLGLIITEQHLFAGKNVTHVRLTKLAVQVLADHKVEIAVSASLGSGMCAQPEVSGSAQLQIQGESDKEKQQGDSTTAFANAHAICNPKDSKKKISGEIQNLNCDQGIKGSAQETSKAYSALPAEGSSKPTPAANKGCMPFPGLNGEGVHGQVNLECAPEFVASTSLSTDDPKALAHLLKTIVENEYGDYVPPPTSKELGQLKTFANRCPPGEAAETLRVCATDWAWFTATTKSNYGAFSLPERPTTGFLLKYVAGAVTFARQENSKKEAEVNSKPAKCVAPHSLPTTVEIPTHKKVTPEEMKTILAQ